MRANLEIIYELGSFAGQGPVSQKSRNFSGLFRLLGRIQDLTKGGSDKDSPKAVVPRGVRGHASRPIAIVLVKCWKVAPWNAKKLLKNC